MPFSDAILPVPLQRSAPGYLPGAAGLRQNISYLPACGFPCQRLPHSPGHAPRNPYGLLQSQQWVLLTAQSVPDSVLLLWSRHSAGAASRGRRCHHRIPPFLLVSSIISILLKQMPGSFFLSCSQTLCQMQTSQKLLPVRNFREAITISLLSYHATREAES